MKTMIKNISLLLCVALAAVSCYRKPIHDDCICNNRLTIPISVDWTKSGVEVKNVTVLFYDLQTGELVQEHKYEHPKNSSAADIHSYVDLARGSYKAVLFNELRNQIDYVSCVDHENLSTLKFEGNSDKGAQEVNQGRTTTTRSYVSEPGDLAVAVIEEITVTDEMILETEQAAKLAQQAQTKAALSPATKATVESLLGVVPLKKNNKFSITVHAENIRAARMDVVADLSNLSDGYFVSSDSNSEVSSTLQFSFDERTYYEDQKIDGTISAEASSFGTLADKRSTAAHDDKPIELTLYIVLYDEDKTKDTRTIDVTDLITVTDLADGSVLYSIETELTDPLPDVTPDGSSGGSGFGSSVDEWGDAVDVPIN